MSATILPIINYPNPILKTVSESVELDGQAGEAVSALIESMKLTMRAENGIGISAIQVGVPLRIFLVELRDGSVRSFINPTILTKSEEMISTQEGCLSFPGIFGRVDRHESVTIAALDETMAYYELELHGIDSVCAQHELDHLNGITFYDHLSALKKRLLSKKIAALPKL
jgi:peptide deformylase